MDRLPPESVSPYWSNMAQEVERFRQSILSTMRKTPYIVWDARDLRLAAGVSGPLGMYALTDLINDGVLEVDSHLRVMLPKK